MTDFTAPGTAVFSGLDEVVRFLMEVEHRSTERVWCSRGIVGVPPSAGIRRVEELLVGRSDVCVVVKQQEGFLGKVLGPAISFIDRLPERVVSQADEGGLE